MVQDLAQTLFRKVYKKLDSEVRLKSGLMSKEYINMREAVCSPVLLNLIAGKIWNQNSKWKPDRIACIGYGGLPIATAVSLNMRAPMFYIRETKKEHGLGNKIDGVLPTPKSKVLLVEDVITTGGSIYTAFQAIVELGVPKENIRIVTAVLRDDHEPIKELECQILHYLWKLSEIREAVQDSEPESI